MSAVTVDVTESDPGQAERTIRRDWPIQAAALAITIVHLVLAFRVRSPITFGDEGGYLGNATYLARGAGRPLDGYVAGYSLLLVPAARLPLSVDGYYTAVLVTNAILAGVSTLLAAALGRVLYPALSALRAALVGLAVSLQPYVFLAAGTAMSENALVPASLASALLFGIAVRRRHGGAAIGAALTAAYCFWVTPRAVITVGAFAVAIVLIGIRRVLPASTVSIALGAAIVGSFAGHLFNRQVRGDLKIPGVGERTVRIPPINSFHNLEQFVAGVAGRLAYFAVATVGLALVGLVIATWWSLHVPARPVDPPADASDTATRFAIGVYTLLSVAGTTLLAASSFTGKRLPRIDHLYYGRYVEGTGMAIVAIGTAWIVANVQSIRKTRWALWCVACGGAIAAFVAIARIRPDRPSIRTINISNVIALVPLQEIFGWREISAALLFGAAVTVVVLFTACLRFGVFAVLLVAVLAIGCFYVEDRYHLPGADSRAEQGILADTVATLHDAGVPTKCILWEDGISDWHLRNYVFRLPDSKFVRATARDAADCGPLAFAPNEPRSPGRWELIARENHFPASLWIDLDRASPEVAQIVSQRGLAFDRPPCALMPASAYRSRITPELHGEDIDDGRADLASADLDARVEHVGAGSPWLGSFARTDGPCGRVSMSVAVLDDAGTVLFERRLPLPRSLLPGESARLSEPLLRSADASADLGAASELRIELVQEGVTHFSEQGDQPALVPLRDG